MIFQTHAQRVGTRPRRLPSTGASVYRRAQPTEGSDDKRNKGETRVKRIAVVMSLVAGIGLLLPLPANAHTPQQPPHQLYSEGDLKLESGEAIKDFSISYVTHGKLNEKKSNAVLMVTAIPADVEFLNRETTAFLDGVTPSAAR